LALDRPGDDGAQPTKGRALSILTILIIVVIVLLVLGFLGRGRFRA
jgi:flagellar basal body-associated protein FliL